MHSDLDEMAELIGRTMEIAKSLDEGDEGDEDNEEVQETDISEFIDRIVTHYQSKDGKAIDWKAGKPCWHVLNTVALRRVLTNLLENAMRYAINDADNEVISVL